MNFKKLSFIGATFLILTTFSLSQRDVGTFVGSVFDEEGVALPGVIVTARNVHTGLTQGTITNVQGNYRIERLPRGFYSISSSLTGFKTLTKEGIELLAGAELKIDFIMILGRIEEEITVVGEAPLVETTRSQVSTVITEKELLSYPQGNRDYLSLIQYAPGTLPREQELVGSGYAIGGMRTESNNLMIDGIDNNDNQWASADVTSLPLEAIQEFRLISNNFSAEYGRNSGGIINTVMKSGTNELHGSAWFFNRGEGTLYRSVDWLTHDRPSFKRYQYGGILGGPIWRDKTFFFLSFEGIRQTEESRDPLYFFSQEAVANSKGFAREVFNRFGESYPVPTYDFLDLDGDGINDMGRYVWDGTTRDKSYNFGAKIDHVFGGKDRISLRWLHNRKKFEESPYWVPGHIKEAPSILNTGGITWLHLFGPNAYNEIRIGYHGSDYKLPMILSDLPGIYIFDTLMDLGDYTDIDFNYKTFQLADVLNFQKGNHSIKLGGELRYWRSETVNDGYVNGVYWYFNSLSFLNGGTPAGLTLGVDPPDPEPDNPYVPGNPGGEWKRGSTYRVWRGIEGGLFIQDDWRVNTRLTLSFGLRWEYFGVPEEISGKGINQPAFGTKEGFESGQLIEGEYNREGIKYMIFDGRELMGKKIWDPYYKAFAPKASFAYDLTGDGKTSLRGGIGVAYDRVYNQVYENDRFNYPDFTFAAFYGSAFGLPPINPTIPVTIPVVNAAIGGYAFGLRWMVPKLSPQKAYNWMIGIQRELAPNTAVEINYTGSLGRNLGSYQRPNRFTGDFLDGWGDGLNPHASTNDVNVREQTFKSYYHALTVVLNKRFSDGWSWYTAYTFGTVRDQVSSYIADLFAVSHERRHDEWGPAAFDRRHRVVGGFVWDLPFFRNSSFWLVRNVVSGWQLAGNFHYTSGAVYDVRSQGYYEWDFNKDVAGNDMPLWLGDKPGDVIKWEGGSPYLDRSSFGIPIPPAYADDMSYYDKNFVTRNMFRWFPTYNIDISLQKYFTVPVGGKDVTVQFIAEVFNLLKSTFWDMPETGFQLAYFGEVSRMSGVRQAQFSVRFMF